MTTDSRAAAEEDVCRTRANLKRVLEENGGYDESVDGPVIRAFEELIDAKIALALALVSHG